ncbi:MAG: Fic family protein [bacterium]|nr:Fic family protein [bacterium]
MKMKQLTQRQYQIYDYIRSAGTVSNSDIKKYLSDEYDDVSRVTIVRDTEVLLKEKYIKKTGAGRSVKYIVFNESTLLKLYDVNDYFITEADNREITGSFNFEVFNLFKNIFSVSELKKLNQLTKEYQSNISRISTDIYRKELERLTIELSWKSSQIEGNTYSLLDTEALIKENRKAPGHNKKEAIMILNHKKALDYIFSNAQDYKDISVRKIEDIHRLLVDGLAIDYGLRNSIVSITGTKYRPLDNQQQIREALENTIKIINSYDDMFHKALAAIVLLSYIQPFVDGNKRTSRLTGNSILSSQDGCPLSYRSVNSVDYKKAILLFYEQNSLNSFKELFISQYEFSVKNYFLYIQK